MPDQNHNNYLYEILYVSFSTILKQPTVTVFVDLVL